MERLYTLDEDYAVIEISSNCYPIVTVQKSISNFIDLIYVKIEVNDESIILKLKLKNKEDNLNEIIGEFYNEMLRESLRYNISKETKNLRELIVGRALYSTCIEAETTHNYQEADKNIEQEFQEDFSLEEIATNWFDNNQV